MTDFSNIIKKARKLPKLKQKKKPKSTTKLRKELWVVFSLYIRNRDKWTCFTCGRVAKGSGMHAGHYRTGATCKLPLYFDERNVHAQCFYCNLHLSGNWYPYQAKMHQIYGEEIDQEFDRINQWNGTGKEFPFEEKIAYYKNLVKE